jgi:diguanylate cyclase (GGDEF)-like protein
MRTLQEREHEIMDRDYQSLFDPATRLARPPLLRDRLEVALARAARTRRMVGVLFVDVDVPADLPVGSDSSFDVLPLIAGRLRSAVRPDDTVGRIGEFEFVVICNDLVELADVGAVADRLRSVIGVRVFLDETKSVLSARVESRLARPRDRARDLLIR